MVYPKTRATREKVDVPHSDAKRKRQRRDQLEQVGEKKKGIIEEETFKRQFERIVKGKKKGGGTTMSHGGGGENWKRKFAGGAEKKVRLGPVENCQGREVPGKLYKVKKRGGWGWSKTVHLKQ